MAGPARTITPVPRHNAIGGVRTVNEMSGALGSAANRQQIELAAIVAKVLDGKTNNTNTLELDASGTTDIDDPRIGSTTIAILQGIDQNGSASIPTISQEVVEPGKIRLTHAASGLTRTIGYALFG